MIIKLTAPFCCMSKDFLLAIHTYIYMHQLRRCTMNENKFYTYIFCFFRIPNDFLFLCYIVVGAYLVAYKFKKVNPTVSYSVFRIFFTPSFTFLVPSFFSYVYISVIIEQFLKAQGKVQKATVAALTSGLIIPITACAKYLVLRKCSQIISPDRAFVLCYFIRGGSIVLYQTMQSGLEDIWLFVALSLLHGVSNILSKATLHLRIKIWKRFVAFFNNTCCGLRLEVQSLESPRIRRLNADLEI